MSIDFTKKLPVTSSDCMKVIWNFSLSFFFFAKKNKVLKYVINPRLNLSLWNLHIFCLFCFLLELKFPIIMQGHASQVDWKL